MALFLELIISVAVTVGAVLKLATEVPSLLIINMD